MKEPVVKKVKKNDEASSSKKIQGKPEWCRCGFCDLNEDRNEVCCYDLHKLVEDNYNNKKKKKVLEAEKCMTKWSKLTKSVLSRLFLEREPNWRLYKLETNPTDDPKALYRLGCCSFRTFVNAEFTTEKTIALPSCVIKKLRSLCVVKKPDNHSETKAVLTNDLDIIFDLLKSYWLTVTKLTKQNLLLAYFFKDTNTMFPWFERIKEGKLLGYLNTDISKQTLAMAISEESGIAAVNHTLTLACLILAYNTHFIDAIIEESKENQSFAGLITNIKAISHEISYLKNFIRPKSSLRDDVIDSLKRAINKIDITSEYNFDKKFISEKGLIVFDIDILCVILGLRSEFGKSLKTINIDIWPHQRESYHVINAIELMSQHQCRRGLAKKELFNMGFTEETAAFIVGNIPEELSTHQSPLYWATVHIENMFQNHPLLTQCNDYPFAVDENVFPPQSIRLQRTSRQQSSADIQVFNVSNIEERTIHSKINRFIIQSAPAANSQYFHGTSHENAVNILRNGIILKRGKRAQDFSDDDGFYLSYVFSHAKTWAREKSSKPAVIVFSVPNTLFERHMGLDVSSAHFDTEETVLRKQREWREIVKYCRNGSEGPAPENFDNYCYIIGNISVNGSFVKEIPTQSENKQLCIKSKEFAEEFQETRNIVCVIFYKTNYAPLQ
ncbi:uncharacterized protein LOC131938702 [Physella acuta]|uniref:uncharacterized protein LOC131938702 n=1 Tax=Physella acuta TaxID=109671 RepID=UPI0027DB03DA|nr:uncharacterized protein LOC131938702 [Physella acuta]